MPKPKVGQQKHHGRHGKEAKRQAAESELQTLHQTVAHLVRVMPLMDLQYTQS